MQPLSSTIVMQVCTSIMQFTSSSDGAEDQDEKVPDTYRNFRSIVLAHSERAK